MARVKKKATPIIGCKKAYNRRRSSRFAQSESKKKPMEDTKKCMPDFTDSNVEEDLSRKEVPWHILRIELQRHLDEVVKNLPEDWFEKEESDPAGIWSLRYTDPKISGSAISSTEID